MGTPHIVTVDEVQSSFLATSQHEVRMVARLVWQEHRAACAQVVITGIQGLVVERCKGVDDRYRTGLRQKPDEAASEVLTPHISVKRAVSGYDIDVSLAVASRPISALPDPRRIAVGCQIRH